MTAMQTSDTDELLRRFAQGDETARGLLLERHRKRLRRMIALRRDPRLQARIDPSDVLQEALAQADQKLAAYARKRPLPFYPWLRRLVWERLAQLHRRHVRAQKRSVRRELVQDVALSDASILYLANRIVDRGHPASAHARRNELRQIVRSALVDLREEDREILLMRFLEDLSVKEIAALLTLTETAVRMRQLRALRRIHELLGKDFAEDLP